MPVDGNTAPVVDTVSVQIPAGVFIPVAALSNSSSICLSIMRIETSARFLYPDDTTRNFEIAVILAVNFEWVTLENLSSSNQISITFKKAEVCFLLHYRLCLFVGTHSVQCCVVYGCVHSLLVCTVQAASSTRCIFHDVGANGGCLLH